jgi:hypothetical protein
VKNSETQPSRSQQQVVLHGEGQQEHSLCGMAFDAFDSGDAEEPIIFAKSGEVVTCQECRAELDFVRRAYCRYRYEPKAQNAKLRDAGESVEQT